MFHYFSNCKSLKNHVKLLYLINITSLDQGICYICYPSLQEFQKQLLYCSIVGVCTWDCSKHDWEKRPTLKHQNAAQSAIWDTPSSCFIKQVGLRCIKHFQEGEYIYIYIYTKYSNTSTGISLFLSVLLNNTINCQEYIHQWLTYEWVRSIFWNDDRVKPKQF
jgi:hypothetical protein